MAQLPCSSSTRSTAWRHSADSENDVGGMLSEHDLELARSRCSGNHGRRHCHGGSLGQTALDRGEARRWSDHRRRPHPGVPSRVDTGGEVRRPPERSVTMTATKPTPTVASTCSPASVWGARLRGCLDGFRGRSGRTAQCARRPARSGPVVDEEYERQKAKVIERDASQRLIAFEIEHRVDQLSCEWMLRLIADPLR